MEGSFHRKKPRPHQRHDGVPLDKRVKSLCLAILMFGLAQTAYVGAFQGWTYLEDSKVNLVGEGCSFITRSSGTPIFVDSNNGSDTWPGTWSCPK